MSKVALLVALVACSHREPAAPEPPPSEPLPYSPRHGFMLDADALITVVAEEWGSTQVQVRSWSRHAPRGMVDEGADLGVRPWAPDGDAFDAVIGRGGLAWGIGLHGEGAPAGHTGPVKREGDGASPAGAFRLGQAFGFEPAPGHRVLDEQTECVDDPKSASYNEIVERTGSADWTSSEHMRSVGEYALGAFVEHNPKRAPGAGSCIFLHVWDGPDSTTVGCTAMPRERLEQLLDGLAKNTVLVQLPKAEYEALRKPWGLPAQ